MIRLLAPFQSSRLRKGGDMKSRIIIVLAIVGVATNLSGFAASTHQEPSEGLHQQSVWDGVYTEEQALRGEASYGQHCASCHGGSLEGADAASALVGPAFTANWDTLTLGDLFDRIRITMPLDRPGSVSRQENLQILTYILKFNKFPSGETELPRQRMWLRQMLFLESKP